MKSHRRQTAYHESGHAVASIALRVLFRYVTIQPRTKQCAGFVCVDSRTVQEGDTETICYFAATGVNLKFGVT